MTPDECINVISVKVPASAIDAAARERIAELTREIKGKCEVIAGVVRERDEARTALAEFGEWSVLKRERDEARTALAKAERERDEAKALAVTLGLDRDARVMERDEARVYWHGVAAERDDARRRVDSARERISELEGAIRTLAKVLL